MAGALWAFLADHASNVIFERVASKANAADAPSRGTRPPDTEHLAATTQRHRVTERYIQDFELQKLPH